MKKLLGFLVLVCLIVCIIYFGNGKEKDVSELFDDKPVSLTDSGNGKKEETAVSGADNGENTSEESKKTPVNTQEEQKEQADNTDDVGEKTELPAKSEETVGQEQKNQETAVFEHSTGEKEKIVGRYIEAEDFYYSMLYQQYDLDSYDVITVKNSGGYETEYHRVLYYDVNSKEDLKNCYRAYFTEDFVSKLDLGSYIEDSGKLYCAQTENASAPTTKFAYSAESIDETSAYVVRSGISGAGSVKIKAVKKGDSWYFSSVAIR